MVWFINGGLASLDCFNMETFLHDQEDLKLYYKNPIRKDGTKITEIVGVLFCSKLKKM